MYLVNIRCKAIGEQDVANIQPSKIGYSLYVPDAPPVTPHANDDEFDDSSFDTGLWTEFDHDNVFAPEEKDWGLELNVGGSGIVSGVYNSFSVPSTASFIDQLYITKVSCTYGAFAGLMFMEGTGSTDDLVVFGLEAPTGGSGGDGFIKARKYNAYNSFDSELLSTALINAQQTNTMYLALGISDLGSDVIRFLYSYDGLSWMDARAVADEIDYTAPFTPSNFGLFAMFNNAMFSWCRVDVNGNALFAPIRGRRVDF